MVSISVVAVDQLTKLWVRHALPTDYHKIEVITNHLDFIHRKNSGIAFSMFASAKFAPFIFAALSLIAVVFILWTIYKNNNLPVKVIVALGAIAGGATGNLIDRIIPPHKVIDFIDCFVGQWHWPAFNIADSAICIGAFLLIIASFTDPNSFSSSVSPSGGNDKKTNSL
ncbi:MAG: signal peptidase II [Chlamydiae bacterium]|nr:MAG: signal peptidase II [Chlamydiota bacterium]